jgi:hypothetical protein
MSTLIQSIMPGARIVRGYAERLLKDVSAGQFARTPKVEGTTIRINHPAFSYGHLALYPARMAGFLGLDHPALAAPPEGFEALFKDGTPCHDDPEGTIYPPMDRITEAFFSGMDLVLPLVAELPDERFAREMPDPNRRERFPTVGAFATYLLLAHPQGHLGQVSAWRRCMGLGPV